MEFKRSKILRATGQITILCLAVLITLHLSDIASLKVGERNTALLFSKEFAIYSIQILLYSTTLFFLSLGTNMLITTTKKCKSQIAKLIDIIWYPLGICTVIIGVYSTQNFEQKNQIQIRVNRILEMQNQISAFIHSHSADCINIRSMNTVDELSVRVLLKSGKEVLYRRKLINLCNYYERSSSSQSEYLSSLSDRESNLYRYTLNSCNNLSPVEVTYPEYGYFETNSMKVNNSDGPSAIANSVSNLVEICNLVLKIERLERHIDRLQSKLDSKPNVLRNPWIWVATLSLLAGLKLSKTLIELRVSYLQD